MTYWVFALLALGMLAYTAWQALPLLTLLFAPRLLKIWFLEATESDQCIVQSPSLAAKISQLRALNFQLLGVKAEKILWQKPVYELALSSEVQDTYASIILTDDNRPAGVYILTSFEGGGVVFTRAGLALPEMDQAGISVKNIASGDLEEMLRSHNQRLKAFKRQGLKLLKAGSQVDRVEASYQYYESAYVRSARRKLHRLLPVLNFALAMLLFSAIVLIIILKLFT